MIVDSCVLVNWYSCFLHSFCVCYKPNCLCVIYLSEVCLVSWTMCRYWNPRTKLCPFRKKITCIKFRSLIKDFWLQRWLWKYLWMMWVKIWRRTRGNFGIDRSQVSIFMSIRKHCVLSQSIRMVFFASTRARDVNIVATTLILRPILFNLLINNLLQ